MAKESRESCIPGLMRRENPEGMFPPHGQYQEQKWLSSKGHRQGQELCVCVARNSVCVCVCPYGGCE